MKHFSIQSIIVSIFTTVRLRRLTKDYVDLLERLGHRIHSLLMVPGLMEKLQTGSDDSVFKAQGELVKKLVTDSGTIPNTKEAHELLTTFFRNWELAERILAEKRDKRIIHQINAIRDAQSELRDLEDISLRLRQSEARKHAIELGVSLDDVFFEQDLPVNKNEAVVTAVVSDAMPTPAESGFDGDLNPLEAEGLRIKKQYIDLTSAVKTLKIKKKDANLHLAQAVVFLLVETMAYAQTFLYWSKGDPSAFMKPDIYNLLVWAFCFAITLLCAELFERAVNMMTSWRSILKASPKDIAAVFAIPTAALAMTFFRASAMSSGGNLLSFGSVALLLVSFMAAPAFAYRAGKLLKTFRMLNLDRIAHENAFRELEVQYQKDLADYQALVSAAEKHKQEVKAAKQAALDRDAALQEEHQEVERQAKERRLQSELRLVGMMREARQGISEADKAYDAEVQISISCIFSEPYMERSIRDTARALARLELGLQASSLKSIQDAPALIAHQVHQ